MVTVFSVLNAGLLFSHGRPSTAVAELLVVYQVRCAKVIEATWSECFLVY